MIIARQLSWLLLLMATLAVVEAARAQERAALLFPPPTAVLIVPAVPNATAATHARRVFFNTTETVDLASGSVMLASTPDGSGPLCTDDEARLTITRDAVVVATWSHRFWSADHRTIICLPPQRLTIPTRPGQYQIQIELEDRYPPTYSSRPYYLVPLPAPTITPLAPPTMTMDHEQQVSSAVSQIEPHPPAQESMPTAAAKMVPMPSQMAQPPSMAARPTTTPDPPQPPWTIIGTGLLAVLVAVPYVIRQRRARHGVKQSSLSGIVYLYDRETREAHTAVFDGTAPQLILRRPVALVSQLEAPPERVVGALQPGDRVLYLLDGRDAKAHTTTLHPDRVVPIAGGAVTIHFRPTARRTYDDIRHRGRP